MLSDIALLRPKLVAHLPVWELLFFETLLQGVNVLNLRTYLSELSCCIAYVRPPETHEVSGDNALVQRQAIRANNAGRSLEAVDVVLFRPQRRLQVKILFLQQRQRPDQLKDCKHRWSPDT